MKNKIENWYENLKIRNMPDEYEAKQLVRIFGIKTPDNMTVLPGCEPDFSDIQPPYVIKICSATILHKTDLKGVVLNISEDRVHEEIKAMQERFPKEQILVEHMSEFQTPEFIIGITRDPALGHAVMVGAGGILTELYKDVAFRLAPCNMNEAMDMLEELTLSPVFENFRGMTHDKEKLARVVERVSLLAHDFGDRLSQLDINPIVYTENEWVALDVKIMFESV